MSKVDVDRLNKILDLAKQRSRLKSSRKEKAKKTQKIPQVKSKKASKGLTIHDNTHQK